MPSEIETLLQKLKAKSPVDRLLAVCKEIQKLKSGYDWVGFYYVKRRGDRVLQLGPYVGAPTEHQTIPFGKGICGQVAESKRTMRVDDVSKVSNYLSCSLHVKSEIVVPILDKNGTFLAQIDIDSHQVRRFDPEDEAFLQDVVECVRGDIESLVS